MTHSAEISARRRRLFYSAAEAARWVAADDEHPEGVDERTWNRWEDGSRPAPPRVLDRLLDLERYREDALGVLRTVIELQTASAGAPPADIALVWYGEADDWPHERLYWRPQQSVLAELLSTSLDVPVLLVPFNARAYQSWRKAAGLPDGIEARAAWAGQAAGPDRNDDH